MALRQQFTKRKQPQRSMDPWIMCRLNPDASHGGVQKPDGVGSCRSITVDHFVADTILCNTSAGFTVQTYPGFLPFTAAINGNGSSGTNDINVNSVAFHNSGTAGNWAPVGVATEWASTYTQLQGWSPMNTAALPKNDPYTSAKARILAVKRRLIYTGSLTNNSGFVTVTPSPYCLSENFGVITGTSTALVAGEFTAALKDSAQTTTTGANVGIPFYSLDVELPTTALFNKDTVLHRVEQGIDILSKQAGSVHQFVAVPDSPYFVCPNQNLALPAAGSVVSNVVVDMIVGGTFASGVFINDTTWCGELINVTGVTTGATFRLETIVCVEYELQSASPLAPMAMKPPAPRVQAVSLAQQMVNNMPVAVSGGMTGFPVMKHPR